MPEIVADCPRCGAEKITFKFKTIVHSYEDRNTSNHFESYCVCKNCHKGTIFNVVEKKRGSVKDIIHSMASNELENALIRETPMFVGSYNNILSVKDFVSLRSMASVPCPEHVPEEIAEIFKEGAESVAGSCPNAAAAMFRACLDLLTKELCGDITKEELKKYNGSRLSKRLQWSFDNYKISKGLWDLSSCIKDDGNDGAHDGSLDMDDAKDLLEFTKLLLQETYTMPAKIRNAEIKRNERRGGND